TYNASLRILAFAEADAKKYAPTIEKIAVALAGRQMHTDRTKGGWSYKGPAEGTSDNSNTHFALLALHAAAEAETKVPEQVWQNALKYWTQKGMQAPGGGFGYGINQHDASGSMTAGAISSMSI